METIWNEISIAFQIKVLMGRPSIGKHYLIKNDLIVNSKKTFQKWPIHYIPSNESKKVFRFEENWIKTAFVLSPIFNHRRIIFFFLGLLFSEQMFQSKWKCKTKKLYSAPILVASVKRIVTKRSDNYALIAFCLFIFLLFSSNFSS